jgi:hypothetical protein
MEVPMKRRRSIITAKLRPIPPLPPVALTGRTITPKRAWAFDHKLSQTVEHEDCIERLRAEGRKTNIVGSVILAGIIVLAIEIVGHIL